MLLEDQTGRIQKRQHHGRSQGPGEELTDEEGQDSEQTAFERELLIGRMGLVLELIKSDVHAAILRDGWAPGREHTQRSDFRSCHGVLNLMAGDQVVPGFWHFTPS